jgi:50S ribosomal protein L16 3-hydroxylase
MLRDWLGTTSFDAFRERYLRQLPLGQPSAISEPRLLLDWQLLSDLLGAQVPADALVVSRGALLPFPAPRSLDELRAYFRMGIGLCLRHTERCHPALRHIAEAFESDLGAAQVQIFVTPGNTHGFGWHFDDEDVFIAQTAGIKDYYFRPNTVAADVAAHGAVFARHQDESSPLHTATLIAGDFLYIPAKWWHMARCRETSLSVSVGVRPRSDLLRH